jgi:hypothetical protein
MALKSSEKRIEGGLLSNSPGYSLLALFMPMTVLIAQVFIMETLFPSVLPLALLIISGGISALAASFYCDFMKDTKSSRIFANIRGGIIIVVIFYISTSLLRSGIPWEERFAPNFFNIPVSIGVLFTWTSVVSLKQLFSARKLFEIYTEKYQGEQLQKVLFEDSALLKYTDTQIIKARNHYLFQLILTGTLTFIAVSYRGALPLPLYLFLIVILAGGICIFGFFGIIRWEQYYAGEGINLSVRDRSRRILGIGIFSLFSIIAAILLASDKSILSFSLITGFFAWFFGLFRRLFRPVEITVETEAFGSTEMTQPLFFLPEENPSVSIWGQLLQYGFTILKYGIIIFIIANFILFMISPLLIRGRIFLDLLAFFRRLGRTAAELFNGIINALVSFFAYLKSDKPKFKLRKHGAKEIHQTAETILGAYSQAKRQDMRQSVTLFARLIIWGSEVRHVVWKSVYAPGEYCGILAAAEDTPGNDPVLQQHNEGIIRCGELFEQALYSAEVLSGAERNEFKNLVEEITS